MGFYLRNKKYYFWLILGDEKAMGDSYFYIFGKQHSCVEFG